MRRCAFDVISELCEFNQDVSSCELCNWMMSVRPTSFHFIDTEHAIFFLTRTSSAFISFYLAQHMPSHCESVFDRTLQPGQCDSFQTFRYAKISLFWE